MSFNKMIEFIIRNYKLLCLSQRICTTVFSLDEQTLENLSSVNKFSWVFWWNNYYKSVLRWLTIFHETTFFTMFSAAFVDKCNVFTVINCLVSFLGYPKVVSSLILNHSRYRHHHYFQGMYNCLYFITVMWIYKEVNSSSVRDNRID